MRKLTQREIQTVKIGAICAVVILTLTFGTEWIDRWSKVRRSLSQIRGKLEQIAEDNAKQKALLLIVPAFEMPKTEEQQKFLFRDKFNEQLKKAGINSKPLQVLPIGKRRNGDYRLLRIKCSGQCKFGQFLDLLASLKENPYLVGVEEMRIKCDPKKPQDKREEIEFDLTVSTFVK